MFEDTDVDQEEREDERKSSITLDRWVHFPAMLVFGVLILLLHGYSWGWQVAIAGGYSVYVYGLALGSGKRRLDEITGDTLLLQKISSQMLPHLFILVIIVAGVTEWFNLRTLLPPWAIQEGRKESLWDLFGWLLLAGSGIAEGFWFAARIKHQFPGSAEED